MEQDQKFIESAHELTATIKDVLEALQLICSSPGNCEICALNRILAQKVAEVFKKKLMEFALAAGPVPKSH